jgi:hypothetical protein
MRPDPHRLSEEAVTGLVQDAGLRPARVEGVWLGFVLQARRERATAVTRRGRS